MNISPCCVHNLINHGHEILKNIYIYLWGSVTLYQFIDIISTARFVNIVNISPIMP